MLHLKNQLGWRLEKIWGAYIIRMEQLPLSSRIFQFSPVLISLLLIICLWLGRKPIMLVLLCVIAGLLVLGLIVRGSIRFFVFHVLSAVFIFISLLMRDDITIEPTIYGIPLGLLVGWLALRPFVLSVNPRLRIVVLGDMVAKAPFSMLKVETDFCSETGRYRVFLRNAERSSKDPACEYDMFECLSWESESEAEAYQVAEKLRNLGVGMDDPKKKRTVAANRKACRLLVAGHVIALVIFLVFISCMERKYKNRVEDDTLRALILVRFIKITIAYIFFSIMPYAVYLIRLGWRAVKHQHIPPPETIIITKTKILEGAAAVRRGKILVTIGIFFLMFSLIGGLFFPYVVGRIVLMGVI